MRLHSEEYLSSLVIVPEAPGARTLVTGDNALNH
jgi:hypothetical protein